MLVINTGSANNSPAVFNGLLVVSSGLLLVFNGLLVVTLTDVCIDTKHYVILYYIITLITTPTRLLFSVILFHIANISLHIVDISVAIVIFMLANNK